jgi:hypothetical protein
MRLFVAEVYPFKYIRLQPVIRSDMPYRNNKFMKILFPVVLTALLSICGSFAGRTQTYLGFEYDPSPMVKTGADTLEQAWAGGLNFVQFSDIDIDYDGDMDLFVFDRSGDEIAVFVTEEVNGEPVYRYLYGGWKLFPSDVRYRAALYDYDQDGRNDLFTYGIGGVKAYRNIGNSVTGLQWEVAKPLLRSDYLGDMNNLYVSSGDIPAFVDVEGDSDMDVLTFHLGGERVEYHQNQSMELYGIPDSLVFVLKNECWGHFREDVNNNSVILNDTESPCGPGNSNVPGGAQLAPSDKPVHALRTTQPLPTDSLFAAPTRHSGSALLALDINDNGVLDLILGDVSYPNLTLLVNGGTAPNTNSAMISQDINFPSNTTPASVHLFPAAFYVDVNHDDVKDLIVGANARTISQNQKSVTYYENLGTNTLPNFLFRSKSFLQGEMIEHGLGSIPVLFDENGDGLRDLLVANFFRYKPTLDKESAFLVYRNTGTAAQPEYTYLDDNFFGLTGLSLGLRSIPAFGDLDGDGDEDMLIGMENGQINAYTNTAGAGNPVAFGGASPLTDNNGAAINVISYAAPQLFDLNNDGLLDLIVGMKTGELAYYRNTGTAANAVFTLENALLGGVDVSPNTPDGYSVPNFFRTNDTTHLFIGAYDGKLHYYNGIDDHLEAGDTFTLVSHAWRGIDVGLYSSFLVEDTDDDGLLNLFIGQDLGGLHHMEADPASTVSLNENKAIPQNWLLVPNPATAQVLLTAIGQQNTSSDVAIYNMPGELIGTQTVTGTTTLDISGYRKGMYLVVVTSESGREVLRLVKE